MKHSGNSTPTSPTQSRPRKNSPSPTQRRQQKAPSPQASPSEGYPAYYPAFLDIRGKRCVIVGGGKVAERKALSMLSAGARVTLISPTLTPALEKAKADGALHHISRKFRAGDLAGAYLVVAATDDAKVNARIARLAAPAPVNVIDNPALCTFIVPSVIRRGPLTIAISTSGASPATSKSIRLELEGRFGPEWEAYLSDIIMERGRAKAEIAEPDKRRAHLKALARNKKA